jgi:deoxyhypusine synthase
LPGWEDSTTGNIFASYVIKGELKADLVKSGIEYMVWLTEWYRANSAGKGVGFFQIGGGIAGDFPICVVPMMYQDLEWHDVPFGVISAKFQIQQHLMDHTVVQYPMKKLLGVN